uniref:Pancreatic trypsin inhibitor n=1 Tax=Rhipicephalus appendiculatus TaxID=34631 RepID=A0A131YG89_RHIAP
MNAIASRRPLLIMLLPAILLYLRGACAFKDVEARRDILECDRRRYTCFYPEACDCNPRFGFGLRSQNAYYYSARTRGCLPGAFLGNCNGFRSMRECLSRCSGWRG